MKKLLLAVTIILMCIIVCFNVVYACDYCDTDEEVSNKLYQALIQKKLSETNINLFSSVSPGVIESDCSPSVGNVRVLVLPIEFANTSFSQESLDILKENFFGDRDSDTFGMLSVKEAYRRASYGKLNLSGDILPVYKTPKEQNYYANLEVWHGLIQEAIKSYTDVDFSQYDGNGDGYVDIFLVEYCDGDNKIIDENNSAWGNYTYGNPVGRANSRTYSNAIGRVKCNAERSTYGNTERSADSVGRTKRNGKPNSYV